MVSVGLDLARSCDNESDWLIAGENMCPMIPWDVVKYTISSRPTLVQISLSYHFKIFFSGIHVLYLQEQSQKDSICVLNILILLMFT